MYEHIIRAVINSTAVCFTVQNMFLSNLSVGAFVLWQISNFKCQKLYGLLLSASKLCKAQTKRSI